MMELFLSVYGELLATGMLLLASVPLFKKTQLAFSGILPLEFSVENQWFGVPRNGRNVGK